MKKELKEVCLNVVMTQIDDLIEDAGNDKEELARIFTGMWVGAKAYYMSKNIGEPMLKCDDEITAWAFNFEDSFLTFLNKAEEGS